MSNIDIPVPQSRPLNVQPPERSATQPPAVWKGYEKYLFRVAFIFFVIMSIPTGSGWYVNLFTIDWTAVHYRDLYDIARFQPNFLGGGGEGGGPSALYGYADWLLILAIALAGGVIWSLFDRRRLNYNLLYYWLQVIVRYRAAIGIIGFAYTKVLPVQMPYPSEGLLNTNFGDLTSQKIYWLSISIVPWYQVFAGIVELTAGILLLFRKTATLGAIFLFAALGDIVYVNLAYDGGVHVYSSYFVLFAAFLLVKDVPKIYNLLVRERYTAPVNYELQFRQPWLRWARIGLKAAVIYIFLILLGWVQWENFRYDPYKQPAAKGITALRGYYEVTEFRLNNQLLPYHPLDSLRWQQVTFEKWTTLTFKVNRPQRLDLSNGGGSPMRDINRTFELAGVGGGQRVFYYEADTVHHVLYLQDKNRSGVARNAPPQPQFLTADQEYRQIHESALTTRRRRGIPRERARDGGRPRMTLHYETNADGSEVVLRGVDERNDSVYVALKRLNKQYTLSKSSLNAGEY
ncbi:hypothetical protein [Chitinophaga sp.]|uniref:hypothetical protein n=1 Tax=Chitinophaga sp. TaxID=1869181 RepID=UPI0031D0687E